MLAAAECSPAAQSYLLLLVVLVDKPQVLTSAAATEMTAILAEIASAVLRWARAIAAHIKVHIVGRGMLYSSNPMMLHSLPTTYLLLLMSRRTSERRSPNSGGTPPVYWLK